MLGRVLAVYVCTNLVQCTYFGHGAACFWRGTWSRDATFELRLRRPAHLLSTILSWLNLRPYCPNFNDSYPSHPTATQLPQWCLCVKLDLPSKVLTLSLGRV